MGFINQQYININSGFAQPIQKLVHDLSYMWVALVFLYQRINDSDLYHTIPSLELNNYTRL